MPIYEFACRRCSARSEVRASIAEKEAGLAPDCPACGAADLRPLLSAFATTTGRVAQTASAPATAGGCCGGGCCAP